MKKILSVLLIAMLVVVGCGKKETKDKSGADISKYKDAPDTIESCPNCVYSNEVGSYRENDMYEYKPLAKDKYSSDWKKIAAESDVIDIFFGYVLDDKNYISDAYVCTVYNNIPYCLGADADANKELIQKYFQDDCSGNGYWCYIPKGNFGKGNSVDPYGPTIQGYYKYDQAYCASRSIKDGYTYHLNVCDTEVEDVINDTIGR